MKIKDYSKRFRHKIMMTAAGIVLLTLSSCVQASLGQPSSGNIPYSEVTEIANKVWDYSQSHPDGFTLDIQKMTEPKAGIAVSYAATQNSHSRNQLDNVVTHALQHDGYVGGWLNSNDGLYYFDSTKLFPESELDDALKFGKENGQHSVFVLSTQTEIPVNGPAAETEFIPTAPNYEDPTMWVTAKDDTDNTGADIFYVVSTWEEDWKTEDGRICHYADVWNAQHREHMGELEIKKVKAYMSSGNNFYAPYYRHTTIEAWMTKDEDFLSKRLQLAMDDVCKAFDYFLAHRDQNRPLVIAGFSQGGRGVVELLKHIDDKTYNQLVAAYVMGYKVTEADLKQCSHIRPAEGETDTGVTICYNTVKDVKYIQPIIAASDICINPVNWHTDATPATLHDNITVTVSPEYHVLVVSGYSGSEYAPYKGFINVGDIHSCEPWLYKECIAKNIKARTKEWRKNK